MPAPGAPPVTSALRHLATTLHTLIAASPYTAAEIARRIGVDPSALSRWGQGTRQPTLPHLVALAALLDVDMATLWGARPLCPTEAAVLAEMADLSPAQQQALLAVAHALHAPLS